MKIYEITFSPTGGTKKVSDIISNKIKSELNGKIVEVDLTNSKEDFSNYKLDNDDIAVIAFPSYGGRAPEVAIERFEKLEGNNAKAILVAVYGNRDYEDTLIETFDSAKNSGFEPVGAIAAIAQHSILPQYASGRPDKEDAKELKHLTNAILDNEMKEIKTVPGNRPYKKISSMPLAPKPTKDCTGCQICVTICPVDAIDSNSFKTDKKKCIACMRCVTTCPANARKVNSLLTKAAGVALKKEASDRKQNDLFL